MYNWLFFLHITGLVVWIGSLTVLFVLLATMSKKTNLIGSVTEFALIDSTVKIVRWLTNPGALVVLLTGIFMIMEMGLMGQDKPFWLRFMEETGGLIIILSIVLLAIQNRRIRKYLIEMKRDHAPFEKVRRILSQYVAMMAGSVVLALVVVYVVSMKYA